METGDYSFWVPVASFDGLESVFVNIIKKQSVNTPDNTMLRYKLAANSKTSHIAPKPVSQAARRRLSSNLSLTTKLYAIATTR